MLDDQPDQQPDQTSGQSGDPSGAAPAPKVTKTTRKRTSTVVTPAASDPATGSAPDAAPAVEAAPETGAAPAAKKAATKRTAAKKAPAAKTAAKKTAAKKAPAAETKKAPAKKTTARTAKKATSKTADVDPATETPATETPAEEGSTVDAPAATTPKVTKTTRTRTTRAAAAAPLFQAPDASQATPVGAQEASSQDSEATEEKPAAKKSTAKKAGQKAPAKKATAKKSTAKKSAPSDTDDTDDTADPGLDPEATTAEDQSGAGDGAARTQAEPAGDSDTGTQGSDDGDDTDDTDDTDEGGAPRRRRRRGGRRRRKSGGSGGGSGSDGPHGSDDESDGTRGAQSDDGKSDDAKSDHAKSDDDGDDGPSEGGSSRRRRRRRRAGDDGGGGNDDPKNTVTRVRHGRSAEDQITSLAGSTRLEAKKQRRREGREAGRRRAPIISEAEFLARREAVDRTMVVRQRDDLTQIAVLEDKVLVEHYVARESQTSLIGNVYLGRVQNVLPSMEAAFVDIGKGRNAVIYAGEVNWSALGHKEGQPRKIESVLQSGQSVLVQVTKDPVGHKGARLTGQISLAGRFLVLVPDGTTNGISRKLPDTERSRLKSLLKEILPEGAGVIVRTAAEGATEEQLTRDVERLKARWDDIESKTKGSAPQLLYGEPDLTLKVVRDLFTEDFVKLVIDGDDAWDTVQQYVSHLAPDLEERLERFEPATEGKHAGQDVFGSYRIDEQIKKGLDRKVWLPSGGSLIIDRTEAMTVVDVNTGKFTGSGGNLEETVTKNNLEAAEEIVRQLRLRDIGGIIVVDFIDMVLESNRDLVVRRLVECLGRDRTRHQVAEVTSLGLVQMTRKRIGTGLVEAFSHSCEHCQGRGVVIEDAPVEASSKRDEEPRSKGRRSRGGRGRGSDADDGSAKGSGTGGSGGNGGSQQAAPSPADVAAMARKPADEDASREDSSNTVDTAETPDTTDGDGAAPDQHDRSEQSGQSDQPEKTRGSRSRKSRSQKPRTEQVDSAEPAEPAEPADQVEPAEQAQPAEPASAAQPVEQTADPVPPTTRVVTRTRRRASRPAGPPAGGADAGDTQPEPTPEPTPEPGRPDPVSPDLADPPAPISTTDGSDVPAEHQPSGVGTPPVTGDVEPGTVDLEPGETLGDTSDDELDESGESVAHVPIKRKGSRKR